MNPVPASVLTLVNGYVESELRDAKRYDNRTPLDRSGVYSLHALAAEIYAAGWTEGQHAQAAMERGLRAAADDQGGDS